MRHWSRSDAVVGALPAAHEVDTPYRQNITRISLERWWDADEDAGQENEREKRAPATHRKARHVERPAGRPLTVLAVVGGRRRRVVRSLCASRYVRVE
jgi:hypothetical protein